MRVFKRQLPDAPTRTYEYKGIDDTPEGAFHTFTGHVVAPRELVNPDVTPDWQGGSMGSEELFTHQPAHVSRLDIATTDIYEPIEVIRRDATKEYGKILTGPGGNSMNTVLNKTVPNPVSQDEMTLTELDPDIQEVSNTKPVNPYLANMARKAEEAKSKFSRNLSQLQFPGM